MTIALVCALLIGQHVGAVVNKAVSQASPSENTNEEKKNDVKADERISNSYGPPADSYGLPISSLGGGFNGPAPVYGPPLNIKPHYGPPKQTFGPLKLHFAPLKQHFGPPLLSFPSFRPPKPQYGPPLKLNTPPLNGFPPASSLQNHLGPVKPGHGPPIPVSIESYRPRPEPLPLPLKPEYGPPSLPPLPQLSNHYELNSGNIHGPPPPPPAGVPAPPTPPDIMYDGWQPIAGLANQKHQGPPPKNYPSSSNGHHHKYVEGTTNANVLSDSYGVPINSPEAHNLQNSVRESSGDKNGLPPPPLPVYDGEHSSNTHASSSSSSSQSDHHHHAHQQSNLQYNIGNSDSLSIVKTVGFELLPNHGSSTSDLQSLSLSHGSNSGGSSYEHSSASLNIDGGSNSALPVIPLQELDESHGISLGNGESHGIHNDITFQQLPDLSSVHFGKVNGISGGPLLPPPTDSYAAPPLSSYSPDGPYPAAQSGRTGPSFPPFGPFGSAFQKHASHHHRFHGHFRLHGPPSSPPASLIPPRNREPIKFREPIPTGLITNLHRYVPSLPPIDFTKPLKSSAPHLSFGPQLPTLNAPLSFHQSSESDHSLSNSFSSSSASFGKLNSHSLNSPLAAPHVQYGTPLSFTDFNTPAPVPTYGAPNFGPASTFGFTSNGFGTNLYDGIGNGLTSVYGTPVVNPSLTNSNLGCGYHQFNGGTHFEFDKGTNHLLLPTALPSLSGGTTGGEENSLLKTPPVELPPLSNSLSSYSAPPVNGLELENYEQQKAGLKDSYGNPVGITYETSDQKISQDIGSNDHVHSSASDVTNVVSLSSSSSSSTSSASSSSSRSQSSYSSGVSLHQHGGTAEALTASLTAQGYGQAKSLHANEVDASQYLKTDEGSQALALAQGLTAEGPNGFQIQGSKGTYTLQIQPADGGFGTENSDGSIRHDQVLSNGLLEDILAAIEQPDQGRVELQGPPQAQPLEEVHSNQFSGANSLAHPNGHYIRIESKQGEDIEHLIRQATDRSGQSSNTNEGHSSKNEGVALFFNNKYEDTRKETRSVNKAEKQAELSTPSENQKSNSKTKSS
ncbi:hypothetical protein KPH14_001464 [Odynerus spinipes]|uniref:Uncharacterized protein n=1 Tax=Odynerus spinipes TaxID=1348599 RepID=A0AAD9RUJ8_9HYME|nr:hypothetical protein KPH14_001464 [Odynerus spinipes]